MSDRYELRSLLGRGGTAEVWQGLDRWLGRAVAVKILHPVGPADWSLPVRFGREARTVAGLSHPNIVAVHDVGADHGMKFLVMELVEGRSLAQRLAEGPMEIAEAVRVAVQVCAALEAAAEAGVVHRDVKPANILLGDGGRVKVCDFGLARVAGIDQGELTGPAQMIGTSAYMAPEQVTGSAVDARTDLYGLGCVLYAMLTGRPPFTGDSPMQIAWQHVERTAAPASTVRDGIPAELDGLLQALLGKYPADRPATPGRVRAALERLNLDPGPARSTEAARPRPARVIATVPAPTHMFSALTGPRGRRSSRIRPLVLAVGAAAVMAVVTTVILQSGPGRPGPQAEPAVSAAAPTAGTPTAPPPAHPRTAAPAAAAMATATSNAPGGGDVPPGRARCRPGDDQRSDIDRKPGRRGCPRAAEAAQGAGRADR
ncbi:serine/threonine-protein kinase [Actinoplanes sandaracinus]|uniref:serine/threonine-protein kinase n=1 Tax=Actinoplanes sandaracinus TaxID=3045177 RepID=UPI0024A96BFD|nr:serine/threonine-protein kinase [Actinoplanes sandaracinus]